MIYYYYITVLYTLHTRGRVGLYGLLFAVLALINGGAMVAASVPRTANTAPSQTLILTRRQSRLSSRGIQSCCWG